MVMTSLPEPCCGDALLVGGLCRQCLACRRSLGGIARPVRRLCGEMSGLWEDYRGDAMLVGGLWQRCLACRISVEAMNGF